MNWNSRWEFIRSTLGNFTPTYGKCGGMNKDCSIKPPIDEMDKLFENHDNELFLSESISDKESRAIARQAADKKLGAGLKALKMKGQPIRARIYRRLAMMVFRP